MILSSTWPIPDVAACNLLWNTCSKIVSRTDASSGVKVSSSASKSATPAAVVAIRTASSVATVTLPNGLNPAG